MFTVKNTIISAQCCLMACQPGIGQMIFTLALPLDKIFINKDTSLSDHQMVALTQVDRLS